MTPNRQQEWFLSALRQEGVDSKRQAQLARAAYWLGGDQVLAGAPRRDANQPDISSRLTSNPFGFSISSSPIFSTVPSLME